MLGPLHDSLVVASAAVLLDLVPAVAVALVLERSRSRWRGLLHAIVLLPLVLPPVVTGYLLLRVFSPRAPLGAALAELGLPIAFHRAGAVVAAAVVGFPLLVLFVAQALRAVDVRLETISRSLGRGPVVTFFRVSLPLAWPGIAAGAVLAFARGLGEFGATIVLAGHIPAETDTIPLAVHALLAAPGSEDQALVLCALAVALGVAAVVAYRLLDARHRRRLELP